MDKIINANVSDDFLIGNPQPVAHKFSNNKLTW